jgi:hypothetical protein
MTNSSIAAAVAARAVAHWSCKITPNQVRSSAYGFQLCRHCRPAQRSGCHFQIVLIAYMHPFC